MAKDEFPALTSDDMQARRLCALAVAFSNAKSPISSIEVHDAHYAGLSMDSFRRKFSRDREKLVECGLVIRQAGTDGRDALWQADEASFADGSSISADDALMLDVLCAQLVDDPSFAYRGELRLALAKVDHAFGALTAARIAPARHEDAALPIMLACMEQCRLAKIAYVDARGAHSTRTVAPYGQFGLRDNVYFVCAQVHDGIVDSQQLRTLRADRIQKAQMTAKHFEVPQDFCAEDHVLLPFQIGPTAYATQLRPTPHTDPDMLHDLDQHALLAGDGLRQVYVSDTLAAARWAIAAGIRPEAPQQLVDEWRQVLEQACNAQQSSADFDELQNDGASRGRRGRRGGAGEMRELVALVGSLGHEGATITPAVVAARLGVSEEHAELLVNLILTACVDTGYQLPLALSEGDGIMLSRSQGVTGRPIRLTRSETQALVAALDELGFPADDPLRLDVLQAFAPTDLDEDALLARVQVALELDDNQTLEACSRAITAGNALSFLYQSAAQNQPSERRVLPRSVRRSDDLWYLDAYDFGRQAMRTFRVDRMSDVRVSAGKQRPLPQEAMGRSERFVEVSFADKTLFDVLEWPRLKVLGRRDDHVVAQLPYYGGPWLPRHLAACGDKASTSDADIASAVRDVARQALDEA